MYHGPPTLDASAEPEGVSRRAMLGASATGLALALLARTFSQATAQESTPMASPAAEGGLPPGVALMPMINVPVDAADVPTNGFTMSIYRITLEPGAVLPNGAFPYPSTAFVESGTLICPGGAPRYVISADGSVREVGDEDVTVNTGEAIYVPPNVLDGARNDGSDTLSVLVVDLVPMEAMATPTT